MNSDTFSPCPVCGFNSFVIMTLGDCTIYSCPICRHEFSFIPTTATDIYDADYYYLEHENWFANPDIDLYTSVSSLLKSEFNTDMRLLDVGCGTGNFLKFMQERGFSQLSGLDIIDLNIPGICYIKSPIEKYAPDAPFDTVTSFANIEHIHDVKSYARRLRDSTRFGGFVVVYTVDCNSFIYILSKLLYRLHISFPSRRLYSPHHVNHFSTRSLKVLMENIGFEQIKLWKTSIPFKALDVGTGVKRLILLAALAPITAISSFFNKEMLQVAIFKRRW